MSLITSCPACGTMFRVVPDQLKISDGWVRCGHCSEVFDATAHLNDESVLGALPEAQATQSAEWPPEPSPPAPDSELDSELESESAESASQPGMEEPVVSTSLLMRPSELFERTPGTVGTERSEDPSSFFGEEPTDEPLVPSPLDAPFVFRRPEVSLNELEGPEPGLESQMLPEDFEAAGRDDEDQDEDEAVPEVSFVRQARERAFWSRPGMRLALAGAVLVLGALLAFQFVWQDRERIALAQPALRPLLEGLCEPPQCTLGAPRQIESIVIDSSGFNRLRNDTYRLSFTLRNTAPVQVAAPAMELTVTDAQDQTLVRRVLSPAEIGAAQGAIPAAGEWSRTVGLVLDTGGGSRVAGYRLLAFYP